VMNQLLMDELTAKNNEALRVLVEEHGVELRRLPDDVLVELRDISNQVVAELADTDEVTRRIYDSYKSFQAGVENYHSISEDAYVEARKLPSN
jgi:TRAP-type mannitol/chloroaromatic compound transport system substrate-binding protein